jgi:hypothetical protein
VPTLADVAAEKALLGAILLRGRAAVEALKGDLEPADFFRDAHQVLFRHLLGWPPALPLDLVTCRSRLAEHRELDRVGGPAYLASLVDGVPSSLNVEGYAQVVKAWAVRRRVAAELRRALGDVEQSAEPLGEDWLMRRLVGLEAAASGWPGLTGVQADMADRLYAQARAYQREPFVGDWLAAREVTLVHGQPRDGKSWLALELALSMATGTPACGTLAASVRGPVLLVGNEDGPEVVVSRLAALWRGRGGDGVPPDIGCLIHRGISLDDAAGQAAILAEVRRLGARLVILDPLRSLTTRADQGPAELRPIALWARSLVQETGCSLLVVHHDVKPPAVPDQRRRSQRVSGGGLFAAVDAPLATERLSPGRTLVTADGFKHVPDPAPVVLVREPSPAGGLRLRLEPTGAHDPDAVALEARILERLRELGGASTRELGRRLGVRWDLLVARLDAMYRAGLIDQSTGPRRAQLWFVAENGDAN